MYLCASECIALKVGERAHEKGKMGSERDERGGMRNAYAMR